MSEYDNHVLKVWGRFNGMKRVAFVGYRYRVEQQFTLKVIGPQGYSATPKPDRAKIPSFGWSGPYVTEDVL